MPRWLMWLIIIGVICAISFGSTWLYKYLKTKRKERNYHSLILSNNQENITRDECNSILKEISIEYKKYVYLYGEFEKTVVEENENYIFLWGELDVCIKVKNELAKYDIDSFIVNNKTNLNNLKLNKKDCYVIFKDCKYTLKNTNENENDVFNAQENDEYEQVNDLSCNISLIITPLQFKIEKENFDKILSSKSNEYNLVEYCPGDLEYSYSIGNEFILTSNTNKEILQKICNDLNSNNINCLIKKSIDVNFNLELDDRKVYFKNN